MFSIVTKHAKKHGFWVCSKTEYWQEELNKCSGTWSMKDEIKVLKDKYFFLYNEAVYDRYQYLSCSFSWVNEWENYVCVYIKRVIERQRERWKETDSKRERERDWGTERDRKKRYWIKQKTEDTTNWLKKK